MAVSIKTKEAAAVAVRNMGGPVATARQLGVDNYQTVQSWLESGIPARYCVRVERLSGVSRRELRAEDWEDYWPSDASDQTASQIGA